MNSLASIVCFAATFAIAGSAMAQKAEKSEAAAKPAAKAKVDADKKPDSEKKDVKKEPAKSEDGVKRAAVANPVLKAVAGLTLTAQQKSKFEEATSEFTETILALRKEGFTQALNKKKADAIKAAREEGKKGRELEAAAMAAIDATDDEKALLKKAEEANSKLAKAMSEVLTEDQIASLPPQVQQAINSKKTSPAKPAAKKAA
jgi:hypothetical protein